MTVFERDGRAGGAFRYAGKAPLFQEVVANQDSFDRYVQQLVAVCLGKGRQFRYRADVARSPELLAPFDRIVIATGARYRFGLGRIPPCCSTSAPAAGPACAAFSPRPHSAIGSTTRPVTPTGAQFQRLARPGQKVTVIGDALTAGKSMAAILSAFEAALPPR